MKEYKNQKRAAPEVEWRTKAKPERLPSPTFYPFFLAIGITFLLWGLIAGWMISVAGCLIMIISLTGWIRILRNETRQN